jgi:hypothetical protein
MQHGLNGTADGSRVFKLFYPLRDNMIAAASLLQYTVLPKMIFEYDFRRIPWCSTC